jgi:hypothetical protein
MDEDKDELWRSAKVTEAASLIDLRLREISGSLVTLNPRQPLIVEPQVIPSLSRASDTVASYLVEYRIEAVSAADRREAFRAEVTIGIVFEFSDNSLKNEDLEAFGLHGVLDIVHPYVREIIHSLTGRMGLSPPLLLEIKKPPAVPWPDAPQT